MDRKLVLIEGLPGSGKTTTAEYLATQLNDSGNPSQWFSEAAQDNPITLSMEDIQAPDFRYRILQQWRAFAQRNVEREVSTVIESSFWQYTALCMVYTEHMDEEVLLFNKLISTEIGPLSPALIYLDHDDANTAMNRVIDARGSGWVDNVLKIHMEAAWFKSRGLSGLDGFMQFWEPWSRLCDGLFRSFEFSKLRIKNPHDDWKASYGRIHKFLDLNRDTKAP